MAKSRFGTIGRLFPRATVELKFGIERGTFSLEHEVLGENGFRYHNEWVQVDGERKDMPDGSRYSLKLSNLSKKSIRVTRLRFPAEGGLGAFLEGVKPKRVSFLRNGYQSWSTTRSYHIADKPLRPRFKIVSLATSNMANLPSNTPGMLSSEMYSVLMDLDSGKSFIIGQLPPFDQFFYILLNVDRKGSSSWFEVIYDFGRQLVPPNASVELDGIFILEGSRPEVEQSYFMGIKEEIRYEPPRKNLRGWCSWYQYYDKIDPDILYRNLKILKDRGLGFDFFQIDDGWQSAVGDWLEEGPSFAGRMKELAEAIKSAGMRPGLWFAPFTASGKSEVARLHPEYLLKDEYGRRLRAGYNPIWRGFYYGLDATQPRFAERLKQIVGTFVSDWGYEYLKCDFLFSACLRGAAHHELELSRSGVLKEGMRTIRDAAGPDVILIGCGMPLSSGIGLVDAMRVGPDTGDFWLNRSARLLRTGSMVGARNSIRNFMARSPMHKRLWLNDPDCVMIRDRDTKLSKGERDAQIDAIALSGGILMYSDDFSSLSEAAFSDLAMIDRVSADCFEGRAIALDVMEKELPEVYYNTSGYVGFFNFYAKSGSRKYDLSTLRSYEPNLSALIDVRSGIRLEPGAELILEGMPSRGSRLFKIETAKPPS